MIYTQPNSQERVSMRYTLARLEPLRELLSAVRIKMEQIALNTKEKGLRNNILNFVIETAPYEEQVKNAIASLQQLFPVNDISHVKKDENDDYQPNCPFECARTYEKKILRSFRAIINDIQVQQEIRELIRSQQNEMLFAFLKIKMLNGFSPRELRFIGNNML
ncbi:hypothetical protein I5907_08320 [Panacibacter sp. DH6]|uniref:Uncharacterized protein n=1 Tax=Panacibacter microcysteis TaxID=2793269 RepID=A0A931E097_9BACT|nr:hypothetical protein [Panacibacter microcysteis]MBG9376237.1 hypothetical protein [Panacibacter microcysteis]